MTRRRVRMVLVMAVAVAVARDMDGMAEKMDDMDDMVLGGGGG
jgi:hypothetical protein